MPSHQCLLAALFTRAAANVSVRPWCDNSMRVQITPPTSLTEVWNPVDDPPSAPTCSPGLVGTDQVGGTLLNSSNDESEEECCARCLETPQCSVWVTDERRTCYLVQGYTGKKAFANRTAGFVRARSPGPPGALVEECSPEDAQDLVRDSPVAAGNLQTLLREDGSVLFSRVDSGTALFSATPRFSASSVEGYVAVELLLEASNSNERIFGLGQGNWSSGLGCAAGVERVVPLERNGQSVNLQQRKLHISIPFAYSTAGYGFLFNMQGYGSVDVGARGVGGMRWRAEAALGLDFWVTALPSGEPSTAAEPIYAQYADATGHAPPLREDAMLFWQSRNRYKSSAIALAVADRYAELDLPVGVFVIDYHNMKHDGDFLPDPACYPSVEDLASGVREKLNATLSFSFWPEVLADAAEHDALKQAGCLINECLGGHAMDATTAHCRSFIWDRYVKPRYYDQGVTSYWLDETDAEGTADGPHGEYGGHGYDTSYGPAIFASNAWVNDWIKTFSDPVRDLEETPMVLTRAVWAGGQRFGVVLWSSDIESTYEELTAQINLGVHASLSGIPWWTSDVGGYGNDPGDGCLADKLNDSPYMRELMVRWYQFGCFSPVFRTHGCRLDPDPDADVGGCSPASRSCGPNEVWSYGPETQVILERYIRLRVELKPYIANLAANVTARGVPTVRPLWWEFPHDSQAFGIDDEYLLGSELLVAPVTKQGATSRDVYFPAGAAWQNFFNASIVIRGGIWQTVPAPLEDIPVYRRLIDTSVITSFV